MSTDYSEDRLIQNSAADLLENELGWTSIYAYDREVLGENGTLGRTTYHEVLLAIESMDHRQADGGGCRANDGAHE